MTATVAPVVDLLDGQLRPDSRAVADAIAGLPVDEQLSRLWRLIKHRRQELIVATIVRREVTGRNHSVERAIARDPYLTDLELIYAAILPTRLNTSPIR